MPEEVTNNVLNCEGLDWAALAWTKRSRARAARLKAPSQEGTLDGRKCAPANVGIEFMV